MKATVLALLATSGFSIAETMKPEFHQTIFIGRPAQEVWNAITQKEIADRCFMAPIHTVDLKQGGTISYGSKSEVITGRIIEIDSPKKLVHSFSFAGSTDAETRVTYEIEAMGGMCALTVRHTGFSGEDQSFANISGGWPVILSSLKTLLETGKELPWPKPESTPPSDL